MLKKYIMIILEGKCKIINPYDPEKELAVLKYGDVIGYSDFLRITVRYHL